MDRRGESLRIRGRKGVTLRRRFLRENPLCVDCAREGRVRAATQVDHVVPLFKGGTNDRKNLQGLCDRHHDLKSAQERYEARPKQDVDPLTGYPL